MRLCASVSKFVGQIFTRPLEAQDQPRSTTYAREGRLKIGRRMQSCPTLARVVAAALMLQLALPAQDAPATFKSNTNLVIINVTVRDRSGKPIANLKKDDFTLLEDGKPQAISVFELQQLSSEALPPAIEAQQTLLRRDAAPPPPRRAEPGAPATPEQLRDHRLIAILFDMSSMQPAEQIRAQNAATKFISQQMTKSDLVEIMTYTTTLKVIEEFTSDRDQLLA